MRIDTHIHPGYVPPPYYDSLLAKVMCWGEDRAEAMKRMERALNEIKIVGPQTTMPYHLAVLADEEFRLGRTHTRWTLEHIRASGPSMTSEPEYTLGNLRLDRPDNVGVPGL